ncbi:MAG: hypothetical protein MUC43_06440 [Pirellula sp.]|jgi:hypothetical protein|nr:hypothetical protein [Pirellula sp.]
MTHHQNHAAPNKTPGKSPDKTLEKAVEQTEDWLRELRIPFFTEVDKSEAHRDDVLNRLSLAPSLVGTNLEALMWLRVGMMTRAHDLVQDAGSGIQAYIHGMIHRLEGDFWNAKYWFRSAGQSTVALVSAQMSGIAVSGSPESGSPESGSPESGSPESGKVVGAVSSERFDPHLLVDRLERFQRARFALSQPMESSQNTEGMAVSHVLEREWWAVWRVCKRQF